MFDVGESLRAALESAGAHLAQAQKSVAHANAADSRGRRSDAAMAEAARAAIFTEALLTAEHARLEELKAVTK